MFINNYCLFYTCVILLCHVGEGPVPTALVSNSNRQSGNSISNSNIQSLC